MNFRKSYISELMDVSQPESSVLSIYPKWLLNLIVSKKIIKIISVSSTGVFQVMSSSHHTFDY